MDLIVYVLLKSRNCKPKAPRKTKIKLKTGIFIQTRVLTNNQLKLFVITQIQIWGDNCNFPQIVIINFFTVLDNHNQINDFLWIGFLILCNSKTINS